MIYIVPPESSLNAMNKDKVLVRITEPAFGGRRPVGEVVKILSQKREGIVGTFDEGRALALLYVMIKK